MSEYRTIRLETDARGVATLTLARPDTHNAFDAEMIAELTSAATLLATDEEARVVVLRGEGRSFCAGGDLNWMRAQRDKDRAGKMDESRALAAMLGALNRLPKPLIARVHGNAFGGGVGLLSVCDLAIAAEGVRFALTETRLGLIPATIGPFVVRRMGEGLARQVFFTGRPFGTEFALRSGLIGMSCPPEDLDEQVEKAVANALTGAPGAIAAAKRLCLDLGAAEPETQAEHTAALLADRWETDEAQAGIDAFFERRSPPWSVRD